MRIKFIKIDEEKAANKAAKKNREEEGGRGVEGFTGTWDHAAKMQARRGKRGRRTNQDAVRAANRAVFRADRGSAGTGPLRGSNRNARRIAHAETKSGQNDPQFKDKEARRIARQNASTEILGNKIVEGFNRLLNELKTPTGGIPRDESGRVKKDAGRTVAAGILATARTGKVPDKPLPVSDEGEVGVGDSESRKGWKEATPEERTGAGKITSKQRHQEHFGKGKLRLPPRPPRNKG